MANKDLGTVKVEKLWSDRKRTFLGLPWSFTKYSFDEERFYLERGFLNLREDECRLYRIMDLELTRNLGQRIFGLGTIKVSSSDKSLSDFEIKNIKQPREVKELLSRTVEEQRDKKRVVSREIMGDRNHDFDDDLQGGAFEDFDDHR